jgi:hypothetical protein
MVPRDNRHPLLAELVEHVGGPRLSEIVRAFEEARDEGPATAISTSITQIFERIIEEMRREDTRD